MSGILSPHQFRFRMAGLFLNPCCLSQAQMYLHKSLKTGYHFNSFIHKAWVRLPSLERHRRCLLGSTVWNLCLRFTVLWVVTSSNFVGRYQRCSRTHLPSCLVSHCEDRNLIITTTRTKNLVLIFCIHLFYDIILDKKVNTVRKNRSSATSKEVGLAVSVP